MRREDRLVGGLCCSLNIDPYFLKTRPEVVDTRVLMYLGFLALLHALQEGK